MDCPICHQIMKMFSRLDPALGPHSFTCMDCVITFYPPSNSGPLWVFHGNVYRDQVFQRMLKLKAFW